MSTKLNPPVSNKMIDERLAGGSGLKAAKQDNFSLLRRVVLANLLWENNAYINGKAVATQISELIPLCNPEEVAILVEEARIAQKLRHTPIFMMVEMCKYDDYRRLLGDLMPKVLTRADMLTDFVALYWKDGKKMLPAQVKKGLTKSLERFNEYQLAKYDRDGAVKLRDVLFLCHAKPPQGKEDLYKRLADRELATPDTWEVALSTGKDKKETWTHLIEEGKIGGLAMLRNLRNMREASVDKAVVSKGLQTLKSSMLLPLDFLKAEKINPEFSREIEEIMISSYSFLPKLPGKTLFVCDISGSMSVNISSKSDFTRMDIAMAMAMLAANLCEDYDLVATAGSDNKGIHASEYIKYPQKGFGVFKQIKNLYTKLGGGGIFTRQCLQWCHENVGTEYARIIVFSDSADCDRTDKIPKPFGKYNYICDVSSEKHGINYKGVWTAEISGWSEHFLTFIAALEGLENKFSEQ